MGEWRAVEVEVDRYASIVQPLEELMGAGVPATWEARIEIENRPMRTVLARATWEVTD